MDNICSIYTVVHMKVVNLLQLVGRALTGIEFNEIRYLSVYYIACRFNSVSNVLFGIVLFMFVSVLLVFDLRRE